MSDEKTTEHEIGRQLDEAIGIGRRMNPPLPTGPVRAIPVPREFPRPDWLDKPWRPAI